MSANDAMKNIAPAAKSVGKAAASSIGIGIALDVAINKLSGRSWGDSLASAAGTAAFMAVAPGAFAAYTLASIAAPLPGAYLRAGKGLQDRYNQTKRNLTVPTFSYADTQQAVTMRQAAVQAIQGSKLNARNALGGEASLMHRSYKDGRY